ncbi:MAG: ABC transporter substrate-binding protein [Gemmatimonadales bacterium]
MRVALICVARQYVRLGAQLGVLVGAALVSTGAASVGAQPVTVTDVTGRVVTLPKPASRVLIDDGRYLVALSLIHPDPVSLIAAWPRDINRIGQRTYDQFRAKFPAIERIPQTSSSSSSGGGFSLEKALAVRPDVAVFMAGTGPSPDQVQRFESAGIAVVFIDFFSHPFTNLEPSFLILGKLVGRERQAQAFVDFRRERTKRIADRLAGRGSAARPKVFVEVHAGMSEECCHSPGKGNIGDYITFVGGHNIGADVLPGPSGRLNVEYVVAQDPAVYIATGGPHLERAGGFVVGPGYTTERSRASLTKMTERPGIGLLKTVRNGEVHGLSHQLLNSPLDILAIEALAKWVHPALFKDLDPAATMAEINRKFLAVPLEGNYWVDLRR